MTGEGGCRFGEQLALMQDKEEGQRKLAALEAVVRERCAPVVERAAQAAAAAQGRAAAAPVDNIMFWRGRFLDEP